MTTLRRLAIFSLFLIVALAVNMCLPEGFHWLAGFAAGGLWFGRIKPELDSIV